MRSFRKILLHGIVVFAFLWGINKVGQFLFEPARDNILITSEELRDREGSIETILLGTSLMHCGMDVNVLNQALGTEGFNLATSAQPISGSYYILKEQLKKNPVERVFYGIGVNGFVSQAENKSTSAKTRVLKLLGSPLVEIQYLLDVAEAKELENLLFCPTRTKNIFDSSYRKRNVTYKLSQDYKDRISYKGAKYTYFGKGYESNDKVFDGVVKIVRDNNVWGRDKILKENVKYLRKMASLCKKNGVEFNLVVFPHAQGYASQQGDLADMDAYVADLSTELSMNLYNYNYTSRPDIYDYLPDSCYMDSKHLNQQGAKIFAQLLAEDYKNS